MSMFGLVAVIGALIGIIIGLGFYVLMSLGLYTMAQNKGIENAWLAWIPYANFYILGKIIRSLKISTFEVPSVEIVLPVAAIAVSILGKVPVLGLLLWIAYIILALFALNKLYRIYASSNATVFTVLSIFGITIPILVFIIRNNEAVELE